MHNFIAIEGIDGSGKTETAKVLADRLKGGYFFTPPKEYQQIREYINNDAPPESRLLYYLSSVIDISNRIKRNIHKKDSVCDRYIWSTIVYYSVIENKELDYVKRIVEPFIHCIVQPTKNVLLTVSEKEQIRRLNYRNKGFHTLTDKLSIYDDNFRKKIYNTYQTVTKEGEWIKVDTTNKSINSIIDEIIKKCNIGGTK